MALIKQYHKDTNTTYVYESESYWDPEKKQSRSRRRVVGKIDPETGEMVPTGKRGKKKSSSDVQTENNTSNRSSLYQQAVSTIALKEEVIAEQKAELAALKKELAETREQNKMLARALKKIKDISEGMPL